MHKAFFLDRDGTINVDYNFVHKPEEWAWCEGAIEALQWMQSENFKIIVVTNQSGISRGRYTQDHVQSLHDWVDQKLRKHDVIIDDWFYAPHHPEHDIDGIYDPEDRKPGTGMFEKAAQKHQIDFSQSYMAGDKISDMEPAVTLGMNPVFIRSRHEPTQDKSWLQKHNVPAFDNIGRAIETLK